MIQSNSMQYTEIVFQKKTGLESCILTYSIPRHITLKLGQLVMVSLRNKQITGIVWKIHNREPKFRTLAITEIIQEKPLLTENQLKLIQWMSEYYFCPIHTILKLFIPKRVFENKPVRARKEKDEQIIKSGTKKLNKEQEEVISVIETKKTNTFLIHGVTGSGKTEIYTQIAEKFINKGKQVLILVPEISLTTQIIEYFQKALGTKATVINSKISEGERYKAWIEIWQNKAKLVIGSRSAIFAPFQELGAIIMDEEHELSYKQDNAPRYSTHSVIEKIQENSPELKFILGSATPSIETAIKLSDSTINIKERIGNSIMPDIEIVDLREEFHKKNFSIFSDRLREELEKTLANKEQAILFINRRGAASSVVCRDCGHKEECKECETAMTYHARTLSVGTLICHHCGKIDRAPKICPKCKGENIRFLGIGTQKIESALLEEFPGIRVLRADKDTTSTKHGFRDIYQSFKKHEADVLVGTQMIAKGLHLPKVNLVGVVLADIGLNIPNFKSSERNFQLMTQVAGRSGRAEKQGKVIIQSYNPDHLALTCTKDYDYQRFFNYEREQRRLLHNPPFGKLATITIQNPSQKNCQNQTEELENLLWKIARENQLTENLEINYYPAYISRLKGNYRYTILMKSRENGSQIHDLLAKVPKGDIMSPNIKIDIDPISL